MDTIRVLPTPDVPGAFRAPDTTIVPPPAAEGGAAPAAPPPAPPPPPPAPPAGPAPTAPTPKRRSFWRELLRGCMVASFVFVTVSICVLLLLARGCSAAMAAAGAAAETARGAVSADPFAKTDVEPLNLARSALPADAPKVLLVRLRGTILFEDGGRPWNLDPTGADAALAAIRKATLDPEVDGILLDVDSGGGEITASDVIWKALKDFRASRQESKTRRFVVTLMGAMAASGAYYVAAASDWIVAHPSTVTGSIGVKIESFNVRQFLESRGVRRVSVTSGPNKNLLSPFHDLTEPQRQLLQAEVDALQARFVDVVAKGRRLSEDRAKELADGRVFLAPVAKENGLVDEVGYLEDAKSKVSSLVGGKPARYFVYGSDMDFLRALFTPAFLGSVLHEALPDAGLAPAEGFRAE